MASYAFDLPLTSSDLTVRISWSTLAAPNASRAHTSISPNLCPPNCALPPSGCWVISEYGTDGPCMHLVVPPCGRALSCRLPRRLQAGRTSLRCRPSLRYVFPYLGSPALSVYLHISSRVAPSKIGVLNFSPSSSPAHPSTVSYICPRFIREGTPRGLSTMSTGVPSSRNGMSSSLTTLATIPLFP